MLQITIILFWLWTKAQQKNSVDKKITKIEVNFHIMLTESLIWNKFYLMELYCNLLYMHTSMETTKIKNLEKIFWLRFHLKKLQKVSCKILFYDRSSYKPIKDFLIKVSCSSQLSKFYQKHSK